MKYFLLLAALLAALVSGPGHARQKPGKAAAPVPMAGGERGAGGSVIEGSAHRAPFRRGKTFAITYNGRTVHAVCRDYGPRAHTGRDIDVSRDVAQRLGFVRKGVATVHIRKVR